jgi:hypothetical protein
MTGRSGFARMAKLVVKEVGAGELGDATHQALDAIGRAPDLAVDVLSLIIKEGARKRPDDKALSAYSFLLGHALDQVRYAVDRDSPGGIALAGDLRHSLLAAGADGRISPPIMHLILHVFAAAKLDMGDELRELMQCMMEADTEAREMVEPGAWSEQMAQMVEELEGDAFAIHGFLDETVTAMPEGMRADFITATFSVAEPAMREAVIGFLCSEWSALRYKVIELIEHAAPHGLVSPTMLRRMIAMRNWLPAEQRPTLDHAIKACRQSGVECATWPKAATGRVLATGIDGSGAHSLLVILPDGRQHAVAALLGKLGAGVRDAWVKGKMPKSELQDVEERFAVNAFLQQSTLEYLATACRYWLAMNVAAGTMPPFGLVGFAETVGLDSLNPEAITTERLIAGLMAELPPERLAPAGIEAALSMSGQWADRHTMLETWFEDSEEVRTLLAKRGNKQKHRSALLAGPLQERRDYWAQLVAWTAFAMKQEPRATDWPDFAIVARELAAGRPLVEVPLMHVIADATIEIHRSAGVK